MSTTFITTEAGSITGRMLVAAAFLALACGGCASGKKSTSSTSTTKPTTSAQSRTGATVITSTGAPSKIVKGVPVVLPKALSTPRALYQTRSVIDLAIKDPQASAGEAITVLDTTTNGTLLVTKAPGGGASLVDEGGSSAIIADQNSDGYALASTSDGLVSGTPTNMVVHLSLTNPKALGHFKYGDNALKVTLSDTANDRYVTALVKVRDFSYFGLGTAIFPPAINRPNLGLNQRNGGYQGRATWIMSPIVNSGEAELANGTIGILNH